MFLINKKNVFTEKRCILMSENLIGFNFDKYYLLFIKQKQKKIKKTIIYLSQTMAES